MTAVSRWALWASPRRVVALVLSVEIAAATLSLSAIFTKSVTSGDLLRFVLLAALSVVYLEVSRQVERQRKLFTYGPSHTNMTSVWALAGAVVLPSGLAASLAALMYLHLWLRSWRNVDAARPYRVLYSAATVTLSCLAISGVVRTINPDWQSLPRGVDEALVVAIAIVVYRVVNRGLVSAAILLSGGLPKTATLLGSWSENGLEFATLVLGGVTAAAILHMPWFAIVVLPAVFLLQHHALLKQLVDAATIDTKTELLNAAAWQQVATNELARAQRQGAAAAVLVIDMDRFKQINDTHGHLAGDAALKAVGEALADELRGYDAVGRFGGEEFAALLPTVGASAAMRVAERVRYRIETLAIPLDAVSASDDAFLSVSASIGVAVRTDHGSALNDLLRAADEALYAAKAAGRNQVRLAGVPHVKVV